MSTCYTVWLMDEFNWEYSNYSKAQMKKDILTIVPHALFEANFNNWLVIDIDKTFPVGIFQDLIHDQMLVTDDNSRPIPVSLG